MTKYAKQILEIVQASRSHLTADQVFLQLREVYPKVALASVYIALEMSSTLRRPYLSQSGPSRIVPTAKKKKKLTSVRLTSDADASKWVLIVGSAGR